MEERDWSDKQRSVWWTKHTLQILVWAIAIATAMVAGGKWLYSRASQEDVAAAIKEIESKKLDKETYDKDIKNIDTKIEKQDRFLGTIHENVIRLMEANDIPAKRIKKDE